MYKHTKEHKAHKVFSIKDAMNIINLDNKGFKTEAKKKIDDIEKCMTVCKINKGKIEQAFEIHQQIIDKEFKDLEALLRQKQD